MNKIIERMKSIPMPVWIGLGLAILVVLWMSAKTSSKATSKPVTDATVGAQGTQSNAGTDQQLGNLTQIFQSGFRQMLTQDKESTELLSTQIAGMGTSAGSFQPIGGSIQNSMNGTASNSATAHAGGQQVTNAPNLPPTTSLFNVPIVDASGGAGTIQVVANSASAAYENAFQGGNTPTGSATPA